jgi:hypothetical protein
MIVTEGLERCATITCIHAIAMWSNQVLFTKNYGNNNFRVDLQQKVHAAIRRILMYDESTSQGKANFAMTTTNKYHDTSCPVQ